MFFFLFAHFSFPASGQAVVTGVVRYSPPVLAFNFHRAWGSAIPLLVDFSTSVALTLTLYNSLKAPLPLRGKPTPEELP